MSDWTWEKEEAPAKEAFEEAYEKITRRAQKGEVSMREAYWFHQTERRFSCKHKSVLKTVVEARPLLWKQELITLVKYKIIDKDELSHIAFLCGGMRHYEFFKTLHHIARVTKYPLTYTEEETKEKESIKKAKTLYYKRLTS